MHVACSYYIPRSNWCRTQTPSEMNSVLLRCKATCSVLHASVVVGRCTGDIVPLSSSWPLNIAVLMISDVRVVHGQHCTHVHIWKFMSFYCTCSRKLWINWRKLQIGYDCLYAHLKYKLYKGMHAFLSDSDNKTCICMCMYAHISVLIALYMHSGMTHKIVVVSKTLNIFADFSRLVFHPKRKSTVYGCCNQLSLHST